MKYQFLIFSTFYLGIISIDSLQAQDTCKCDYIESGYYQLVYEADIAYLEGNDSLAYEKLQEAETTCPLLNQIPYQEMNLYSRLLLKNNNFGKALHYMEKLATEYGKVPFNIFSVLDEDSVLTTNLLSAYPTFNDSIVPSLMQKSDEFYTTPECKQLIAELTEISKADQEIREKRNMKINPEDDPVYILQKQTDTINAKRFFEIVEKQGYPNTKRYGDDFRMWGKVDALVMHISDHFNIEAMILQYIRDGECQPNLYGIIIDRKTMLIKDKRFCLYAAYDGTKDDQIIDIAHLDARRMAIGLPTWEMHKKRQELMGKIHGQ
jgi:hypothetical protein